MFGGRYPNIDRWTRPRAGTKAPRGIGRTVPEDMAHRSCFFLSAIAGGIIMNTAIARRLALGDRVIWMGKDKTKTIFTIALAALALVAPAFGDPVPSNRRIDWTYTGVPGGIPNRTNICATFSPGATAAAINNAINACNNGVVLLNAGTYTAASLNGTIQLYKSNVTLRGAGADQTILTGRTIINMGNGGNVSLNTNITGGATKGATSFTVASTANLTPGTMIEIDRADDTALVVNTGKQGGGTRNVTQVNMITAVSGNTVTVRNPLIYDFMAGTPRVKFYFVGITKNSGMENLKLDHAGFTTGGYNSMIQYCDSCWLKGVDSGQCNGLSLYHSWHAEPGAA